jgi:tetratricopeptide (TPR) repeat protein
MRLKLWPAFAIAACLILAPATSHADTNSLQQLLQLGADALKTGNSLLATKKYQEAVDKNPNSHQAWYRLAEAQYKSKSYEAAIKSSSKAIELAPDQPRLLARYHAGRAWACYKGGLYGQAVKDMESATEMDPGKKIYQRWLDGARQKEQQMGPGPSLSSVLGYDEMPRSSGGSQDRDDDRDSESDRDSERDYRDDERDGDSDRDYRDDDRDSDRDYRDDERDSDRDRDRDYRDDDRDSDRDRDYRDDDRDSNRDRDDRDGERDQPYEDEHDRDRDDSRDDRDDRDDDRDRDRDSDRYEEDSDRRSTQENEEESANFVGGLSSGCRKSYFVCMAGCADINSAKSRGICEGACLSAAKSCR